MKKLIGLLFGITIFTACTNVSDEVAQTLNELGLEAKTQEMNICMTNQLTKIYEDLEDATNFELLKMKIADKKIKTLEFKDKAETLVSCEFAILDPNQPVNKRVCDPATLKGSHKQLSTTQIEVNAGVLSIITNSQSIRNKLYLYKSENLHHENIEDLLPHISSQTDHGEYISIKKLENLDSFDFYIEGRSVVDVTKCGESLSLESLLNLI